MTQKNCARAYGEHSGKRSEAYLGDNEKVSTVSQEEVYACTAGRFTQFTLRGRFFWGRFGPILVISDSLGLKSHHQENDDTTTDNHLLTTEDRRQTTDRRQQSANSEQTTRDNEITFM